MAVVLVKIYLLSNISMLPLRRAGEPILKTGLEMLGVFYQLSAASSANWLSKTPSELQSAVMSVLMKNLQMNSFGVHRVQAQADAFVSGFEAWCIHLEVSDVHGTSESLDKGPCSQRFKLDDSRDQIHHRSRLLIVTPSYYFIKPGSTILRVIMVKLLMQRIRRQVPFSRKLRVIITAPRRLASPSSFTYTEGTEGICTEGVDKKTRTAPRRLASPSSFTHIDGGEGTSTKGIDKKTQTAPLRLPYPFIICAEGGLTHTITTPWSSYQQNQKFYL
ncbi:hypothetical protein LguiA_029968 [Lonicera macranthoides]